MAETGWRRIDSYYSGEVQANEYFSSITRSNNTITINGLRSQWRVTIAGNDTNVWTRTYFNGAERQYTHYGNPSWGAWNIKYGNQTTFSINVGANDTQARTSTTWGDYSGSWNNGDAWFNIPALGAPSGMSVSTSLVSDTTARLHSNVASWGANATAGSGARLEYKTQASSSWTNLAWNDPGTHSRDVTGLTPNTQYNLRNHAVNGGGKSNNGATINFYTLANATETSKAILATTASFVLAASQGVRATTAKIQYHKQGDATWIDSPTGGGATPAIDIDGLLPNTTYDYRLAVTTSDGTWTGAEAAFTTLPAGKIIYSDGTTKNAIPHIITPGNPATMVDVEVIQS